MLIEEKFDEIGSTLQHSSQKPIRCLAEETGV
jgi:hypothetical protein